MIVSPHAALREMLNRSRMRMKRGFVFGGVI
jgi:hypothetical protein